MEDNSTNPQSLVDMQLTNPAADTEVVQPNYPSLDKPEEEKQVEEAAISYPKTFKSSTISQPLEVKDYLTNLLNSDPYNKFCVDCHVNLSTHACITYGTFVCS